MLVSAFLPKFADPSDEVFANNDLLASFPHILVQSPFLPVEFISLAVTPFCGSSPVSLAVFTSSVTVGRLVQREVTALAEVCF